MTNRYIYKKLVDFINHNEVEIKEDEFVYSFLVTDKELLKIDELSKSGIEVDRFEGDQSYERRDLTGLYGQNVKAVFLKQSIVDAGLNVYSDWGEYLSYRNNILTPQNHFLILEDGNLYPFEKEKASRLKNYLKITKFIRFLDGLSELESIFTGGRKPKVVFVQKVRIDVLISYGPSDLDNDLDGFESLERIFASTEHETQKNSLMRETLYSFLYSEKQETRFQYLISSMSEFSTEFMENYSLFVSEFSLEKVRKDYEESKREYVSKINEVVSGIHTRMLGVPAVLVLAAFRFSDKAVSGQVVGNIIIFSAVLVYALMMHYLIKSQKDTLKAIKSEAAAHIERFKSDKNPDEVKSIGQVSAEVQKKCTLEMSRLSIFYWMIGILTLVMLGLLLYSVGVLDSFFDLKTEPKAE